MNNTYLTEYIYLSIRFNMYEQIDFTVRQPLKHILTKYSGGGWIQTS